MVLHGEGVLNLCTVCHMQQLFCNTVLEVVEDRSHGAVQLEVQAIWLEQKRVVHESSFSQAPWLNEILCGEHQCSQHLHTELAFIWDNLHSRAEHCGFLTWGHWVNALRLRVRSCIIAWLCSKMRCHLTMSGDYKTEMLLQMYELAGESVFAAPKVAHRVPRAQAGNGGKEASQLWRRGDSLINQPP